jgi:hypothetical protein
MNKEANEWHLPPDGTIWMLDWQDKATEELIGSLDVSNALAAQVTEAALAFVKPADPGDLMAGPITVDEAFGTTLAPLLAIDFSFERYDYYLGVVQAPK